MAPRAAAIKSVHDLEAECLTYGQVARLLGVSEKHVQRHPPPGKVTLSRNVRFVKSEVLRWIAAGCPR